MELVITLLVVGAILLVAETVLPGLIAGIVGLCCLLAGVVVAYVEFGAGTGTWVLIGVAAALCAGTFAWLKYFPESRMARPFVSQGAVGDLGTERPELLGQTGTALSHLRPSGSAVINGQRVDVVTEGALIEKGSDIKVVAVEGLRVVVRAL
jgi:membrane-bound serine protease (ClpP class)